MRARPLLTALGVAVLMAAVAAGAVAFFGSRDDSTLQSEARPGVARPAGQQPVVRTGNVVLLYRDRSDRAPLAALQEELSGPPDPALEAAGQAVIVRRTPSLGSAVAAISASHRIDVAEATNPGVRAFVEFWLGRATG